MRALILGLNSAVPFPRVPLWDKPGVENSEPTAALEALQSVSHPLGGRLPLLTARWRGLPLLCFSPCPTGFSPLPSAPLRYIPISLPLLGLVPPLL